MTTRDILGFAWQKVHDNPEEFKQIAGFAWDAAKKVYKRTKEHHKAEPKFKDASTQVNDQDIKHDMDKLFWNELYNDVHNKLDEQDAQLEEALRASLVRDPELTCHEVMECQYQPGSTRVDIYAEREGEEPHTFTPGSIMYVSDGTPYSVNYDGTFTRLGMTNKDHLERRRNKN